MNISICVLLHLTWLDAWQRCFLRTLAKCFGERLTEMLLTNLGNMLRWTLDKRLRPTIRFVTNTELSAVFFVYCKISNEILSMNHYNYHRSRWNPKVDICFSYTSSRWQHRKESEFSNNTSHIFRIVFSSVLRYVFSNTQRESPVCHHSLRQGQLWSERKYTKSVAYF